MGLMDGKKLLITGVLTDASLAFEVAKLAQLEGAEVVLTGAGRAMRLTERTARKLPEPCDVLALDVTEPAEIEAVAAELATRWGYVDSVLHAIGFAPEACLGGNFLNAEWEDVSVALHISAYSLKALAGGLQPLLAKSQGNVVGLTFDASVAWPVYDWMGVAKAAFGERLDGHYYCPHLPEAPLIKYRRDCLCHKPKPGMVRQAAEDLTLDLSRSVVVGDRKTDIELAQSVGARGVLVKTGYGPSQEALLSTGKPADLVTSDLLAAVGWILNNLPRPDRQ